MIYHVTSEAEWEAALAAGKYEAPSLHTEGFIHMSTQAQVAGVLNRYYKGKKDLLLLHIDEAKLHQPVQYDLAPSVNEYFPHIYSFINTDAVVKTESIPL